MDKLELKLRTMSRGPLSPAVIHWFGLVWFGYGLWAAAFSPSLVLWHNVGLLRHAFEKYDCSVEREIHIGKCLAKKWQIGGRRSGKLEEGRNATLQPNPVKLWKFGRSDLRVFVLIVQILCLTYHIQWNFLAKRHPEVLFTSYMAFVLPTLITRGSGNLTR